MTDRDILLALVAGIQLCDHIGDAMELGDQALKVMGVTPPGSAYESDIDLHEWLVAEHGAQSLWTLTAPGEG
jgi:hypothetical protein